MLAFVQVIRPQSGNPQPAASETRAVGGEPAKRDPELKYSEVSGARLLLEVQVRTYLKSGAKGPGGCVTPSQPELSRPSQAKQQVVQVRVLP